MERLAAAALTVLLGVAALLAVPLVREGFWCDEAVSIEIARAPSVAAFFHDILIGDGHPPLFNALLAGTGRLFGWRERPIKLFALFWGLLSIAGIATAAWQTGGPYAGVLAAAIALHSPLLTAHTAETKGYAMSVAFLTLGAGALARAVRTRSRRATIGACALLALGCWSNYIALLAVSAAGGCALLLAVGRGVARSRAGERAHSVREALALSGRENGVVRIAIANLVAAATTLPLLPIILAQARVGMPYESPRTLRKTAQLAAHKIGYAMPHADYAPAPAGAIALAAVCVIALLVRRGLPASLRARVPAMALLAAYAVPVFAVFGPAGLAERYVIVGGGFTCAIAALLLVAIDDAAAPSPRVRIALRAAIAAYLVLSLGSVIGQAREIAAASWAKSGARALAAQVAFQRTDLVLAAPDVLASTVDYYSGWAPIVAGYPQWERPQVTDTPRLLARRNDPRLIETSIAKLETLIRERQPRRVFLVSGTVGGRWSGPVEPLVPPFVTALSKRWTLVPVGTFPGRVETLYVWRLR